MLRSTCRSIGIRACSLLTPDPIFASIQYLDSTHNSILFFQVIYIICRSNIKAIFSSGSSSLLVIFSNLAAQAIMLRRLIFQDQKEFFFSSANVLTGQPGVSTLPVVATTLGSQVFPPSQSQHPYTQQQLHPWVSDSSKHGLYQVVCSIFMPQPRGERRKAGTLSTSTMRNWATGRRMPSFVNKMEGSVIIIKISYVQLAQLFLL